MAGGFNANIMASCISEHDSSKRSIMASTPESLPLRSFHGFRVTIKAPKLELLPPPRNENPDMEITLSTSGIANKRSVAWCSTALVLSTDAPTGNCTDPMKYPISSSGT